MLGDGGIKSKSYVQGSSPPIIENYHSPVKRSPDISAVASSHHRSKSSVVIKEREFIRNSPVFTQMSNNMAKQQETLQKKNDDLLRKISILNDNIQTSTLQIKTQETLLIQKEDQIIALKRHHLNAEKQLSSNDEVRKADIK